MNSINLLNELKTDFSNLESDDSLDKLYQRLEMVIRKTFDSQSHYLDRLSGISFYSPIYFSESTGDDKYWFETGRENVVNLIDTMLEDLSLAIQEPTTQTINLNKQTKVFIVHGHDNLAKTEVALFLQRLGLEPIILHEQVNSGKTIIEKIEANTDVGFGVVLYTPCDLGKAKDNETLNQRARQNVVFEHGFLIGKLGRDKVLALVKGSIEYPSDISGVVYEVMDNNNGWHIKLAKELKTVGYDIDLNKAL